MTIETKIIADSINPDGKRITTLQCRYPRFIHSQVMTHRMFSRNAQSSRACPVDKMIEEVEKDPAIPIHWGANQKGMQADEECNNSVFMMGQDRKEAWLYAMGTAVVHARAFSQAGYHKQIVNRLLEPFMHISVIITATEWDNFFNLRCHEDSQPEIQALANSILENMTKSKPKELMWGEWHIPYSEEIESSVACAARVSYNNHDGSNRSLEKDIKLHDTLLESKHMSPFEHQAMAMRGQYANLNGWRSYRMELENNGSRKTR